MSYQEILKELDESKKRTERLIKMYQDEMIILNAYIRELEEKIEKNDNY